MIRKKKTLINRHLKVKINGTKRTRTIFNFFKNGQECKEYLIAKALRTEKGRVALAMSMPIREELQKQRFMRGF